MSERFSTEGSITWVEKSGSGRPKSQQPQGIEACRGISHFGVLKRGQNGILRIGQKSCRSRISAGQLPGLKTPLPGVVADLLEEPGFSQHGGVLADIELEALPLAVPNAPLDSGQTPVVYVAFHVLNPPSGVPEKQPLRTVGICEAGAPHVLLSVRR